MSDSPFITWQKSPTCTSESCLEVARVGDEIAIRDSKDPHSPILRFTREEWDAFAAGVKADAFVLD